VFGLYALINAVLTDYPASGLGARLASAADWVQLCVFVPVAYALRGDQRRLLQLLALALFGLLLGGLLRLDWALLLSDSASFLGSRPGFGFPAIVFALFSGIALIGLSCCAHVGGGPRPGASAVAGARSGWLPRRWYCKASC
jgi:hypothetical protein